MTIRTNTPNLLDNPPAPVQAKLAAAWTSFMFLYMLLLAFILRSAWKWPRTPAVPASLATDLRQ
jgi:hypothetical protein